CDTEGDDRARVHEPDVRAEGLSDRATTRWRRSRRRPKKSRSGTDRGTAEPPCRLGGRDLYESDKANTVATRSHPNQPDQIAPVPIRSPRIGKLAPTRMIRKRTSHQDSEIAATLSTKAHFSLLDVQVTARKWPQDPALLGVERDRLRHL